MSALLVIKKLLYTKSLGTVSSNPKLDMSAVWVTRKSSGTQLVTKKLVTSSKETKMKMKMEVDQRFAKALVEFLNESISDAETKKENQRLARFAK